MNKNIPLTVNGKVVFIGDLHFGIKKASIEFLENQLKFFENEVFPYMKENNIKYIFQFGDFFDNRTSADIRMIKTVRERLFEYIKENDIIMYSLLGNHDIALRESRDISLIEHFSDLYPDNFYLFRERERMNINKENVFVIPWITTNDTLEPSEIKNVDHIFGHLEIRNFAVVKGHMDETSVLTSDFFKKSFRVKNVFSGHYHIKSTDGLIYYLGTPYALNWNDYDEEKGFYVWDEEQNLDFHLNTVSKKFIKLKYNNEQEKGELEISGLYKNPIYCNFEEFKNEISNIKGNEIKFFVNKTEGNEFDEYLYILKENNILFSIINNQQISELIEADYVEEIEDEDFESTRDLIVKTVKENKAELIPLVNELFSEIDSLVVEVD